MSAYLRRGKGMLAAPNGALQLDQLFVVENYWEAVGVVQALRAGVAPSSVRRPIRNPQITNVTDRSASQVARGASKEASSARPPLPTTP